MITNPATPSRRIAVLLDGTWNHPDQKDRGKTKPSNVTKLARAVKPVASDGSWQISYYDDGVGTSWGLDRWAGGGLGIGVAKNIYEAYRFLVYNYVPGDEIFIFGFSRGAWTARSLANLIERFGLLQKNDAFFIQAAFDIYAKREGPERIADFLNGRKTNRVAIHFIGVWDTVGSIGLPTKLFHTVTRNRWNYHDVSLAANVRHAFHALAIDERRKPFGPTLWEGAPRDGQVVEQRWFAGVHSNIGGGYEKDGLANLPLHWIAKHAVAAGLDIDTGFLSHYRAFFGHEIRDSFSWPYRLLGAAPRHIGRHPTETVDRSVYVRWIDREGKAAQYGQKGPYRPANLAAYLKRESLDAEDEAKRLDVHDGRAEKEPKESGVKTA